MIPEAAVEAAAKGIFAIRDDAYDMDEWEDLDSTDRELFTCQALAALEAAAPHMLSHERQQTADAHRDAMVNAQTVDKLNKAIIAVNKVLDEKYRLWAAICGNTCSKDVLGVDHDAIADEVGNVIRAAMAEALSK